MQHKVFIVEDNKTSMNMMRSLITKARLLPICTTNLAEAKHVFLVRHQKSTLVQWSILTYQTRQMAKL